MKIGILYICTGKYNIFFNSFYESAEKYFMKDHEKTYYVFTEGEIYDKKNIVKIHQPYMGFPNDTLKRYHLFNNQFDKLIKEDYLFFLNANMLCISDIGDEILPNNENNNLMAVHHPAFYKSQPILYTYERNPASQFYIPVGEGKYYYQGCFNGGKSKEFLKMSKILADLIDIDQSNNILPIWWDESALNWYLKDKNPLLVNPGYSFPEGWSLPFEAKIIQRNKNKFGGYNFLRQI